MMLRSFLCGLVSFGIVALSVAGEPDVITGPGLPWEKKFESFRSAQFREDGHMLPYRFHEPAAIEPEKRYPLVVFFHGAGERGSDNRKQFLRFAPVVPFWETHPCFVLAPQCPTMDADPEGVWVATAFGGERHSMKDSPTWPMRLAMDLIDRTIAKYPIDRNRIYVTGLSMGGFATWEILQREGGMFAAAVPVCGGGDTAFAGKLAAIPLWVFHGDSDGIVPVARSRDMVEAIKGAGGSPKYTEYPGVDHDAWSATYANPAVWDWLFAQRRP